MHSSGVSATLGLFKYWKNSQNCPLHSRCLVLRDTYPSTKQDSSVYVRVNKQPSTNKPCDQSSLRKKELQISSHHTKKTT